MGKWRYGVILDAGSSGTRLHIYKWLRPAKAIKHAKGNELHSLPQIKTKKKWTKKIHPGISTYADNTGAVGHEHLAPLFDHALKVIPKDEIEHTPIFLQATAGVRLLPDVERKLLLQEICDYARTKTNFHLPDCDSHIQVISGETEGLYGWLATNYLLGGFDHPAEHDHGQNHHTYGFLDMGGASAQIAFAPNSTESEKHGNDLKLVRMRAVDGSSKEYRVFVATWLGFGANEARRRYVTHLLDSVEPGPDYKIPDPCLPKGLAVTTSGQSVESPSSSSSSPSSEPILLGSGRFRECLASTIYLLDKDAACPDLPCLFHGMHVPAIDFSINHFVGVSEYWHTTHDVFEASFEDKAYDLQTYQNRVSAFCGQQWTEIEEGVKSGKWGKKADEQTVSEVCFKASWLINMLHEGIGIPRLGLETDASSEGTNGTKAVLDAAKEEGYLAPFQAVNKIDNTEVSWTLGKIVLYATSQIPPASPEALAVGFGSNEAGGLPTDFQFGGGSMEPIKSGSHGELHHDDDDDFEDDDNEDGDAFESSDWRSQLLNSSNMPRRAPGFIMFLLIVVVIGFLLCGRERRKNIANKIGGLFRHRGQRSTGSGSAGLTTAARSRRKPWRQQSGGLAAKLPFSLGGLSLSRQAKYERLLEEGDMPDPAAFELRGSNFYGGSSSSVASDDDERDSKSSKASSSSSSSRRIANVRRTAFGSSTDLAAKLNSHESIATFAPLGGAGGAGAGAHSLGLSLRVDSRDRLDRLGGGAGSHHHAGGHSGGSGSGDGGAAGDGALLGPAGLFRSSGSRTVSPSRWRSPNLTPWKEKEKENID